MVFLFLLLSGPVDEKNVHPEPALEKAMGVAGRVRWHPGLWMGVQSQAFPSLAQYLGACVSPAETRHILKSPAIQVCCTAIGGIGRIICILYFDKPGSELGHPK